MNYAIYGVNRVAKDFMYIFDKMKIKCFFEESTGTEFLGRKVYSIDELYEHASEWDKLIICGFDKELKRKTLERMGLKRGREFVYEEDMFHELDDLTLNPEQKKILVWGTGRRAEAFKRWNERYPVELYIDSNKNQKVFYDIPVKAPSEIRDWNKWFIIIAVADDEEIRERLNAEGLEEYSDFCNSQEIMRIPSELIRKTIFERKCYNFQCNTILNHAELGSTGSVHCCCTTFLDIAIGNINKLGFNEIWHGIVHKILCLSLQNRTYSFCKKDMCPLFIGKAAMDNQESNTEYVSMRKKPSTVLLAYDETCNLKCVTCRQDLRIASGKALQKVQGYAKTAVDEMLPECEFLILAGNGEVFASRSYKQVYTHKQMDHVRQLRLLTNGTLFTEKNWNSIRRGENMKVMLTVSIDAASKETYEKIRCGGSFEQLQNNMMFASKLRKEGELSYFRMNFVVQRANYREMSAFVKWGLELGADEIFFTKILNWGTYTDAEFREVSMMEEDGVTPKAELQQILDEPVLNHPIVDMGTIRCSHRQVKDTDKVKNYYRWELERKVSDLFCISTEEEGL